ncbi:MAG: response regulator [Deltaproteobacteria bacterium]|nr:response regulator [Deltaproteobacteria bacterium]
MPRKIGNALVVGAGISGIRAALDLAETGYGVTLIERAPHLGGILSQLDYQFPTDRCGMCKMLPLVDRDASSQYCLRKGLFHENIEILLSTDLVSVTGEAGNFDVTLRQKPSWVDPALCIGCGACAAVCPVEVPDAFNSGMGTRKAVYLPVPHAIPNPYVIDFSVCTRCGACEKVCPTGAIRLSEQERKQFRILVVDDELIVRDSLKEWLEEEGFAVDMAESGPEALKRLAEGSYHLMLTDIKMPGMDGVEVLQKAKEVFPDLCVVMMTAYATVETAVAAMKTGALDYLVKPFDPDKLIPMVLRIYEDLEAARGRLLTVGALVLCGGTSYYDPSRGKNTFGYGVLPGVVTSLEFERIFSGTGPSGGRLVRPGDERPVRRVAWVQCVGSRDLQSDADFCSTVCCMAAIKEAVVAGEKTGGALETTIFYMDMRTFGKTFQRYRDRAEAEGGVRFERGRVHSVAHDDGNGDLIIRYVDTGGLLHESRQDMVVLAVGQRPAAGAAALSEMLDIPLNRWGFGQTVPFSLTRTQREGVLLGGSFSGLKDIAESVTQASAAALAASRTIHGAGGGLAPEPKDEKELRDVSREVPRILVAVCACDGTMAEAAVMEDLRRQLSADPLIEGVEIIARTCTAEGWNDLMERVESRRPNRVLIGACLPYVYARQIRQLARKVSLHPSLMDVVDIRSLNLPPLADGQPSQEVCGPSVKRLRSVLEMGLARLKRIDPSPSVSVPIQQRALVVGGGIAGMTAALAIADHGFPVTIVERAARLGGNLIWLKQTLEGQPIADLLSETLQKVDKHPLVSVRTGSRVLAAYGYVGQFFTTIENPEGGAETLEHGITILATGGDEAPTTSYGFGTSPAIITQKELEQKLADGSVDPMALDTVVMIQCVDSREEPRNYCSRVCCASALKHALQMKERNPNLAVYVLYRDMMTYGFTETYYTRARKSDVGFIQYSPKDKPRVAVDQGPVTVTVFEPIIGKTIEISTDLLVLATGVVPNLPAELAAAYGIERDVDGFFQAAESKWRPVDALKEGVFACGLAHSPRSIAESIATAEAAAQRSLRILSRKNLPAGRVVARVHHSLCSLCERCIEACPYGARMLDVDQQKVIVNLLMCQGCGSCATACPNKASVLEDLRQEQMLAVIDAALL